jgi:hypothetical protein
METIQYSLNNNISIDIQLYYSEKNKYQENIAKNEIDIPDQSVNNTRESPPIDTNDIFDEHCLEIYGNKTCIFIQIDNNTFQQRFLNSKPKQNVKRLNFCTEIPALIEKSYTVVVVEEIEDEGIREIVAIHSPGN